MTKKDFELIAAVVKGLPADTDYLSAGLVAIHLADALATTNPRFNRGRFLEACSPRTDWYVAG